MWAASTGSSSLQVGCNMADWSGSASSLDWCWGWSWWTTGTPDRLEEAVYTAGLVGPPTTARVNWTVGHTYSRTQKPWFSMRWQRGRPRSSRCLAVSISPGGVAESHGHYMYVYAWEKSSLHSRYAGTLAYLMQDGTLVHAGVDFKYRYSRHLCMQCQAWKVILELILPDMQRREFSILTPYQQPRFW